MTGWGTATVILMAASLGAAVAAVKETMKAELPSTRAECAQSVHPAS
jgi:hypothetical protein